jgi:TRAP-type C4-dicarboxylate transport system substrate-binding protein
VKPPLAALAGALLILIGCTDHASVGGVRVLRYATPYTPQHPFSRADKTWIEHIEKASKGQLRIEAHWSGSLLSSSQSLIELRHGIADIGAIQPIYARGGAHTLRTQAAFYAGALNFGQQVHVYKCLAKQYQDLNHELTGLHVLAVQGGSLPGLVTRTATVRSLADLKGLRLRAPSELMPVLRSLKVDPVNLPMSDVYAALAKGVIDGVIAPADALRSLHLADVAKAYTALAIPRGAYPSRAIRSQALQKLSPELRRVIDESSGMWEAALAREVEGSQQAGRTYAAERGMHWVSVSEAEQRAFDRAYNAAAKAQAHALQQRGVPGEEMFRSAQAWIAGLRGGAVDCSGG